MAQCRWIVMVALLSGCAYSEGDFEGALNAGGAASTDVIPEAVGGSTDVVAIGGSSASVATVAPVAAGGQVSVGGARSTGGSVATGGTSAPSQVYVAGSHSGGSSTTTTTTLPPTPVSYTEVLTALDGSLVSVLEYWTDGSVAAPIVRRAVTSVWTCSPENAALGESLLTCDETRTCVSNESTWAYCITAGFTNCEDYATAAGTLKRCERQ